MYETCITCLVLGLATLTINADPTNARFGRRAAKQVPTLEYASYIRGPVCTPSDPIRHPASISEVVSIVQEAIGRNMTCKAIGKLYSATDIICTSGIPVSMARLRRIVYNPDRTVTVESGATLRDLGDFLLERGRALESVPASGNISIGGAVGTGAHGSSLKYKSSISEQVQSLLIVDGMGTVRRITEEGDLQAFRLNLGLLGIVLEVTLRTVPLYKVRAYNYALSDEILTNGSVIDMIINTDQIALYWFPSLGQVVVANWTHVDVNTKGNGQTADHVPPTTSSFNYYATRLLELAQAWKWLDYFNLLQGYSFLTLITKVPDFPPIYSEDGRRLANPAVGYSHLMLAPVCGDQGWNQCPWLHKPNSLNLLDNEFGIPLEKLPEAARTVKDVLGRYPAVFPFQGILLRFSRASKTKMSLSKDRNTCHFEFYIVRRKNSYEDASMGLAAYQTIVQSMAFNYSGRSHWGKTGGFYHSKEMLDLRFAGDHDARNSFIKSMKKFDPNGVFLNDFGLRLLGTGTRVNTDPAVTHCALLDNCICGKGADCSVGQVCSALPGYAEYPVCMSPKQRAPIHPYQFVPKFFSRRIEQRIHGQKNAS